MKNFKKFAALLLITALSLSFFGCSADASAGAAAGDAAAETSDTGRTIDEIKTSGELVVGTSADYPPYEFHTEINGADTIVGFDIAFAQYIADSLGVKLKVVDMSFDSLLISLDKGDFDLVMAGLTPTDERKKTVDFTDVIFTNPQIVIIRTEDADKYTTAESLKGASGGYQKGTIQQDIATGIVGEDCAVGLTKFYDLITELKEGKLDCVFTNKLTATSYVAANPDLAIADVGIEYEVSGFAGAVHKGNQELADYCNQCFKEMDEQGLIDQYIAEAVTLSGADSVE
ncbi:MAG: transporter substrate-binding domain-containing protein [Oscillospiraceae bacterium]|nr:transporter substrate-binding domain-containing protein [Oscillospiraceae bacterium]